MKEKKYTIRDIAKEAGLSPASVSMILNKKNIHRFSDESVSLVNRIAKEHNYILKHAKNESGKILLICPSTINPYYATLIQCIEHEAIQCGLCTIIATTYWEKSVEKRILEDTISSNEISGIIFTMIPQQRDLAYEASLHIPMVTIGDRMEDLKIDTVEVNNYQAGMILGKHLLGLGHRNIAYISSALNDEHSARVNRLKGLTEVVKNAGGQLKVYSADIPSFHERTNIKTEHDLGLELTQKCMSEAPEITGLVAINDMVAYGVMDAVLSSGFKIPDDYSICAFDNIYPSSFAPISLTSIDHFIAEKGQSALRLLLQQTQGSAASKYGITRVSFESRLIKRNSTGPVRKS